MTRVKPGKTIHMHLCVRGTLTQDDGQIAQLAEALIDPETGEVCVKSHEPTRRVREVLVELLDDGVRAVPFGEPCEGFSDQTGCPGHYPDDLSLDGPEWMPMEDGRE